MSGSDLLPLVAVVLRDKTAVEAAEEIEDLRKKFMEARLCHRKIDIVASDGTVLATASLEGIEPKKDNSFILSGQYACEMAAVHVPVKMVDGIRANKKQLDHLFVRVGGINLCKLEGNPRPFLVNHEQAENGQDDEQHFSLTFPTFFRGHGVMTDENIYQVSIDGHKLILNNIIFTCGSRVSVSGRDILGANDIGENVVFKAIKFSALVEQDHESNPFLLSLRRLFQARRAPAP